MTQTLPELLMEFVLMREWQQMACKGYRVVPAIWQDQLALDSRLQYEDVHGSCEVYLSVGCRSVAA